MFSSLSFKKLRRRLRAITLFKKFAKKPNKKQKAATDDVEQRSERIAPVVDSVTSPEIVLPSVLNVEESSAETFCLPTPIKVDQLPVDTVHAIEQTLFASENEDVTAKQNSSPSSYIVPAFAEKLTQDREITTQGPLNRELNSSDPEPSELVQPIRSVGDDVAQGEKAASLQNPEPVYVKETAQGAETASEGRVNEGLSTPKVTGLGSPKVQVQLAEIPVKDSGDPSKPVAVNTDVVFPSVAESCAPESPRLSKTEVQKPSEHISDTPPQTPRSTDVGRARTLSTGPRKRIASEVRENQDSSIMSELQASVRSREKRRLEKEKIEAEEKKRQERELRQSVVATMGKVVTEQGVWKAEDAADEETTIREVRSWRKQREASLKGTVDEIAIARAAAYHEAMSNEKIMVDLMSTVQKRASRAPCFVDPREKRQTVLEDLFARRVQVGTV